MPNLRPGLVERAELIDRLRGTPSPLVTIVAPAGYGKTTLLAQWAEREARPFAWVSLDAADDDPWMLLSYVAAALDRVADVDDDVFDALAVHSDSVAASALPRLSAALWSMSPLVLAFDDVQALRGRQSLAALSTLIDHVPQATTLVFSSRRQPALPLARHRGRGRVLEVTEADLALDRDAAARLLEGSGIRITGEQIDDLHRRTEGWPVALYLAGASLKDGGSPAGADPLGGDRTFAEYLRSEVLAPTSRAERRFLLLTSILAGLSGPLCDAVTGRSGSGRMLESLHRSHVTVVSLDGSGGWYRYHDLLRDALRTELLRVDPELVPSLHRRAAEWYVQHGSADEAVEHAMAADDPDLVARVVGAVALDVYHHGRLTTLERWIRWLEEHGTLERYPSLAVTAAWHYAITGKPAQAERWADAAERAATAALRPSVATIRAALCRDGPGRMRCDAEAGAHELGGVLSNGVAMLLLALAFVMEDRADRAEPVLGDAAEILAADRASVAWLTALAVRAFLAMDRQSWNEAEALARQAREVAADFQIRGYALAGLSHVVSARLAQHRGDPRTARDELVRAQRLRNGITYAMPHVAVLVRLESARSYLALGDGGGAWAMLKEIDDILRRRPGLGVFVERTEDLRTRLHAVAAAGVLGYSALTAAELRILPLLSTNLSFEEIGAELFISRNTVKSEAVSMYRKLGVSSRSEAVRTARDLGLLDR